MIVPHRRVAGLIRRVFAASVLIVAGCGDTSTLESVGISGLRPSTGWKPVEPARFIVPGRAIVAWTGPDGSSLVVFSTLSGPKVGASSLLKEISTRFANLPELQIVETSARRIGGVESAYFEVVAPGTGDELAPTGLGRPIGPKGKSLIPTRRISLGIPGRSQTLWLTWHAPDSSAAMLRAEMESVIKEMSIREIPLASY